MPTSIAFDREVVGFEVKAHRWQTCAGYDWVLLDRDESQIRLNTAYERQDHPVQVFGDVSGSIRCALTITRDGRKKIGGV